MTHIRTLRANSPKQLAALVILVMMAMVLSFVELPLVPGASWLKYDPSGIIAALAAFLYGPWIGCSVAVLAWIPRLVTNPLGSFMNILSSIILVIIIGLVYRKMPTFKGAVLGVLVGMVCSTAASIILNFVVMPIYQPVSFNDIVALILPALLPFNMLKSIVNGGVALIAHRRLEALLMEDGLQIEDDETTGTTHS